MQPNMYGDAQQLDPQFNALAAAHQQQMFQIFQTLNHSCANILIAAEEMSKEERRAIFEKMQRVLKHLLSVEKGEKVI